MFVVGMKDGTVKVYDEELKFKKNFKQAKEWISDIKFSPISDPKAGTVCCIGSHDNAIYAYTVTNHETWNKKGVMKKHSSYITHLDFTEDGTGLHSNCGAYELLFWDLNQCKQLPSGATAFKDEKWFSWNCVLGWPV